MVKIDINGIAYTAELSYRAIKKLETLLGRSIIQTAIRAHRSEITHDELETVWVEAIRACNPELTEKETRAVVVAGLAKHKYVYFTSKAAPLFTEALSDESGDVEEVSEDDEKKS